MTITSQNAQVKTASVSVQLLTMNNKQVTLSVFRQIQEDNIFDWENRCLKGEPWGFVNYLVPQEQTGRVMNVIWQKGPELRRCLVVCNKLYYKVYLTPAGNGRLHGFQGGGYINWGDGVMMPTGETRIEGMAGAIVTPWDREVFLPDAFVYEGRRLDPDRDKKVSEMERVAEEGLSGLLRNCRAARDETLISAERAGLFNLPQLFIAV